ncbi:YD repeat-containing protein [Pedobacter westerhofensis]|uniref:YD repeat-containing protein n=2 Tax=Pedobacter westerhofensis TaxID=425512 RepID=A0A521F7X5_9SPHI|nr:YD repeat-containing protein [Pedobacter westerhofensis]
MLSAFILLIVASCSKSSDKPMSQTIPPEIGTFLLRDITYNGNSSIIAFKYNGLNVSQTLFSIYRDEMTLNSAGQIESTTTYSVDNNSIYRFNKVYYGSNKKISKIEHSNAQKTIVYEVTDYIYDSSGRVTSITMNEGSKKSVSKYDYNSSGNVIVYTREIYLNGLLFSSDKVTNNQFDDKKNPLIEIKDFEYYLSLLYQSNYDRLGTPIYPTKNNPVQSTGASIYNGALRSGDITSTWKYNSNGYPTENQFRSLVGGSLNVTYGFKYLIVK